MKQKETFTSSNPLYTGSKSSKTNNDASMELHFLRERVGEMETEIGRLRAEAAESNEAIKAERKDHETTIQYLEEVIKGKKSEVEKLNKVNHTLSQKNKQLENALNKRKTNDIETHVNEVNSENKQNRIKTETSVKRADEYEETIQRLKNQNKTMNQKIQSLTKSQIMYNAKLSLFSRECNLLAESNAKLKLDRYQNCKQKNNEHCDNTEDRLDDESELTFPSDINDNDEEALYSIKLQNKISCRVKEKYDVWKQVLKSHNEIIEHEELRVELNQAKDQLYKEIELARKFQFSKSSFIKLQQYMNLIINCIQRILLSTKERESYIEDCQTYIESLKDENNVLNTTIKYTLNENTRLEKLLKATKEIAKEFSIRSSEASIQSDKQAKIMLQSIKTLKALCVEMNGNLTKPETNDNNANLSNVVSSNNFFQSIFPFTTPDVSVSTDSNMEKKQNDNVQSDRSESQMNALHVRSANLEEMNFELMNENHELAQDNSNLLNEIEKKNSEIYSIKLYHQDLINNLSNEKSKMKERLEEEANEVTEYENKRWKDYATINMYRLRVEVLEKCLFEVLSSIALDEDKIRNPEQQRNKFLLVNDQEQHGAQNRKIKDCFPNSPSIKNTMPKRGLSRTLSSSELLSKAY